MEGAVRGVDARALIGGVRLDMRRAGVFADPSIGPGCGRRHAELEQREEKKRRPHPQRAFPHRRHITRRDSTLTGSVTLPWHKPFSTKAFCPWHAAVRRAS